MKTNLLILMLTVAAGFMLTYALSGMKPAAPPASPPAAGREAAALPDFSFTTLDGKAMAARDLRGRAVLINFWATWCPPCVAEFPMLLGLAARYPDDLVLLAISSDRDRAAIDRFMNRLSADERKILEQDNVLLVLDEDSRLTFNVFQTALLPETIIVSPDLRMLHKIPGANWQPADLAPYLPFINGEDPAAQTAGPGKD